MANYNKCLQICFILIQILFIALGLALIGLGAWLEITEGTLVAAVEQQAFLVGPYIIIAVGVAIVLVAFVGMVGAMCDHLFNRVLLVIYVIAVIIIFILQIVAAVLGFVYRDQAVDFVNAGLTSTLTKYNASADVATDPTNFGITQAWDFAQTSLVCCGVNNFTDWLNINMSVPDSCCLNNNTCVTEQYNNGCSMALITALESQLVIVAAVGIAFLVAEVVVVLMAFCLLCCTDFDKE